MSLISLAWTNLSRRRLRSGVTLAGVALAVAAAFSLVEFGRGYQMGLRTELDRLGAHLLVVPKGCPYDAASLALHGASWPCYLKGGYLTTVERTPHVAVAAPVLMSAVYEQKTGAQVVYCGVRRDITDVKRLWKINGSFPVQAGDILAGADAARTRGWRVGQTIALPGLNGRQGRIAGILSPTQGADDLFLYLNLTDAQKIFVRPGELTHILVRLDAPDKMDEVVAALRGCDAGLDMNVVPLAHLFHTIENLVQSTRLLLACVALVALLAAGAGVSNTLLMAVAERTREIGVLRAVGATRGMVWRLIWAEASLLCLLGGMAGVGIALGGARCVEAYLRASLPFAPRGILVRPEPIVILACLTGALALGTLAALIPARRAARLTPTDALRTVGGA